MLGAAALADPDVERRAPVALAADGPVDVALEPLAEAARADLRRLPADRAVQRDEALAQLRREQEPARPRHVDERRAAAPAVRVGVLDRVLLEQQAALLELLSLIHISEPTRLLSISYAVF